MKPASSGVLTAQGRVATLARLMPGLPQYVDPLRLAETEESIAGRLAVSAMPRLREVLRDDTGVVDFRMTFRRDDQGSVRVLGEFSTSLCLACQRCLEPLTLALTGTIDVTPVTGDDGTPGSAPAGTEPLMLSEGRIHLPGFIEDEVLLALPIAPMHEGGECAAREDAEPGRERHAGPFATLRNLNIRKE
jgi:uncharacterized protein